jgi:hypothetical protein
MGYIDVQLLGTLPGTCPECGLRHESDAPHDQQSLAYQYSFFDRHGRWPIWADAMEHCPRDVKGTWRERLAGLNIAEPQNKTWKFDVEMVFGTEQEVSPL